MGGLDPLTRSGVGAIPFWKKTRFVPGWETNLDFYHVESGESCAIEVIVESEERVATFESVGADEKVGQNAARAGVALFPSTRSVSLEGSPGCPPNRFTQGPVNAYAGFPEE